MTGTTVYDKQWQIFEEAIKRGWKGEKPSVLGTHHADRALGEARAAIEEAEA